jgi:hypothetical protein
MPAESLIWMSSVSRRSSRFLVLVLGLRHKADGHLPVGLRRSSSSLAFSSICGRACSINSAGTPSLPKARSSVLCWAIRFCRSRVPFEIRFAGALRFKRMSTRCCAPPSSLRVLFSSRAGGTVRARLHPDWGIRLGCFKVELCSRYSLSRFSISDLRFSISCFEALRSHFRFAC